MNQETTVLNISNEKDLTVALINEFAPHEAIVVSNAVEKVLSFRLPNFTNKKEFDRKAQKTYFSIKSILGEASRFLASNADEDLKALAVKLDAFLGKYKVKGVFFMKNFKFAAVSTLEVNEDTFTTDVDGTLTTNKEVGFDVQPVSLFTSMLVDFLDKGDKLVNFSYKSKRIKGKTHTTATLDPNGVFTAIDLRAELIVCEVAKNSEMGLVLAQQAIVEGFKAQVEGLPIVIASYEYKSASQGRTGSWVSGQLFKDDKIISFVDFLMDVQLNLLTLGKDKGDAIVVDLMKDPTRAPLMASTGKRLSVLNDVAAGLVSKKVSDKLTTLSNGKFSIAVTEDIEIIVEDAKFYALDKASGKKIVELSGREVRQVLNDGVTVMDAASYRRYIAAELGYLAYGENTFRMTSGMIKGLIIPKFGLKDATGFDMITTQGNVKGFAAYGDGKTFDPFFTIIIEKDAAKSHRFTSRWIPYQVLATNEFERSALLKVLTDNVNDYNGALDLDVDSDLFKTMFSDAVENDAALEGLYNTVLKALDANASYSKHPYISYCMTKMLDFFAKELRGGKVRMDGRYSLMAQDVEFYAYVLTQNIAAELSGNDGVYEIRRQDKIVKDFETAGYTLIEAGTVVTPDGKGKKSLIGDVLANRFPLTHRLQSVLVKAVDNESYNKLFEAGFYHSLIIFSAFDIILISMAGADCDGDACLVIIDATLVNAYKAGQKDRYAIDRVAIVDKYIDEDGKIHDGVPYKAVDPIPYELPDGFSYETQNGNAFAVRIEKEVFNRMTEYQIELVLHEVNKFVSARTIEAAQVGRFTNHIMRMTQAVEDLRARAKTGNRKFVQLNGAVSETLEYPEYMGTRMDVSGNLAAISFTEWATEQADVIEADILAWQWVLQYELDKSKHGGAFYEAMKEIVKVLDQPRPGCRVFTGVDSSGQPLWEEKKNKEGEVIPGVYVYNNPTWLNSKANEKSHIMMTNIESLRIAASKHLNAIDSRVVYKNMSNVSELAKEFAHYEENHVEFNALANEIQGVYTEYNRVVSSASRLYEDQIVYLASCERISVARLEAYKFNNPILAQEVDRVKDARQDAISSATAAATIELSTLEQRYALSLKDSTRAVLHVVYSLVNTVKRVQTNTDDFATTKNPHSLVKGMSFFWSACMPQIAKASDSVLYAAYLEQAKTSTSYRSVDKPFTIAIKLDSGIAGLSERILNATANGNSITLTARKFSDVIAPEVFIDFEGNRHAAPAVTYNRYELYLTLNGGKELLVGYVKDDSIFMLNGFEEATITINNASPNGGRSLHFITSTDVVITEK